MGYNNRLLAAALTLAFVCVVVAKVEIVSLSRFIPVVVADFNSLISRYSKVMPTATIMPTDPQ